MHTIIHMQICVKKGGTTGENGESYCWKHPLGKWVADTVSHMVAVDTYQSRSSCTYFCLSRDSRDLGRFGRFAVDGMEWTEELFLLEDWDEWEEWERLARDWPALWSNCIKQKIRSVGTSSNSYGGLVMTYLEGENKEVTEWGWLGGNFTAFWIKRNLSVSQVYQKIWKVDL